MVLTYRDRSESMSDVWTRPLINALLKQNNRAVERAMVRLHDLQTRDEQRDSTTRVLNNAGFSAAHARRGTYYARWVLGGRRLTGWHLENARKIALRHSRQLVEIANGEG